MKYELTITDPALTDLLGIAEYIAKDSVNNALKFHDKIIASLQNLEITPFIGTVTKIKRLKTAGYRMLIMDNYIAYYIIDEDKSK